MSILGAIKISNTSAESITWNRVISKWVVGAPWEPIRFGVNVSNSGIDVLNVTLFYSINSAIPIPLAIPTSFSMVAMQLAEGDLRSGFWTYTLFGQPNSTSVYYAYAVYYVDGSYDGPVPSLDQPYRWEVYSPERVFTLTYLGIANVDPTTLTVDIECSFNIVWDSNPDSLQIEVFNKVNDYYYTDQQYVTVSSISNLRYQYSGSVRIDNLHLIGDPSLFPFDSYSLQLEFRLYGADRSETTVQNIGFLESTTNVWNFSYDKPTAANDTITAKFQFERRVQNAFTVLIPLLTCCFLLGASLLLSSLEYLTARLTIYIALLFFLFNFTSNIRAYVPETALGTSFAEMVFLYMPVFVGIYVVLSILGRWVSDFLSQDSRKFIVVMLLDFVAVLSAVTVFACWNVVQSTYTSKTLIDMMPDYLWKAAFLLALSFGLIFNLGKAALTFSRTHKKPHLSYIE